MCNFSLSLLSVSLSLLPLSLSFFLQCFPCHRALRKLRALRCGKSRASPSPWSRFCRSNQQWPKPSGLALFRDWTASLLLSLSLLSLCRSSSPLLSFLCSLRCHAEHKSWRCVFSSEDAGFYVLFSSRLMLYLREIMGLCSSST